MFLTAATVAALWVTPLASSLWLDETITYWVVSGGFSEMIERAREFQSGSTGYFTVAWLARHLGEAEVFLRLPSLAAAGAGAILVHRIARRLFDDREAAALAVLVFANLELVKFAAADARPYALAVTLLMGSALALLRWLDRPSATNTVVLAVVTSAVVYTHYIVAVGLAPLMIYVLYRVLRTKAPGPLAALVLMALILVLLAPLTPHVLDLFGRRDTVSFQGDTSPQRFARLVLPPFIIMGIVMGLAFTKRFQFDSSMVTHRGLGLLAGWLLIPPTALFAISIATTTQLLFDRYFISIAPAIALLAAWTIRGITPRTGRRLVAVTISLISVLSFARVNHSPDDWRLAVQIANRYSGSPTDLVLVEEGLVESLQVEWYRGGERTEYLLAPLSRYPAEATPMPLPIFMTPATARLLEEQVVPAILTRERFVFISNASHSPVRSWIDGRIRPAGYVARVVGTAGSLGVMLYESRRDR